MRNCCAIVILVLCCPSVIWAGQPAFCSQGSECQEGCVPGECPPSLVEETCASGEPAEEELSNLTLWNLCSEGWNQRFRGRSRKGRAPRFHYFTTKQAYIDREIRVNYLFFDDAEQEADEHLMEIEAEIPFNRRFMLDVEPYHLWTNSFVEDVPDESGPGFRVIGFLQLVDTYDSALNLQIGVNRPSTDFGEDALVGVGGLLADKQTLINVALAGFEDLTRPCGLYRVGLDYHLEYIAALGPGEPEEANNILTYGVAIGKTFVEPDAKWFADFTLFLEHFGAVALDGPDASRTEVTFTPGLRWNLGTEKRNLWLMAGVEFPVAGPRPFEQIVRVSLIHWFD